MENCNIKHLHDADFFLNSFPKVYNKRALPKNKITTYIAHLIACIK